MNRPAAGSSTAQSPASFVDETRRIMTVGDDRDGQKFDRHNVQSDAATRSRICQVAVVPSAGLEGGGQRC